MAEAAATATDPDVTVRSIPAEHAAPADVLAADGLIFVAPENLAGLSGPMKDFLDRCYYPVLGQIEGRPYAAMIAAGSDGAGAVRQIERTATGWRLRKIADAIVVNTKAQTPEAILAEKHLPPSELARCTELGAAFVAGLAAGVF